MLHDKEVLLCCMIQSDRTCKFALVFVFQSLGII